MASVTSVTSVTSVASVSPYLAGCGFRRNCDCIPRGDSVAAFNDCRHPIIVVKIDLFKAERNARAETPARIGNHMIDTAVAVRNLNGSKHAGGIGNSEIVGSLDGKNVAVRGEGNTESLCGWPIVSDTDLISVDIESVSIICSYEYVGVGWGSVRCIVVDSSKCSRTRWSVGPIADFISPNPLGVGEINCEGLCCKCCE